MKTKLFIALLLLSGCLPAWGQIGGDYNPENPSDPGTPVLNYTLTLTAVPSDGGSFNISNERLAVGSSNSLYAYTNKDFVFKHWMIGDSVLSSNPNMNYIMPSHNVQMVGVFEYNPASPANPNKNHWDKLTGVVIVDDFTPGNLSSAISAVISGSSSNEVEIIIVSGRINSNDFGIANNYKNCALLDLSRVTGITEVPSYAFDYTSLESVYVPATVESIGARAFAGCANLSSLTIYSPNPPSLGSNVFTGVPEGLVVYVPAAAIAQYQEADGWKNFTILPIHEDIRSISVSLPEGSAAADYTKMWLELTNTKSGQRMHYVMTDRTQYTFSNIIRNTTWNVTLRNERGDVFGKIDNVEVKDEDVSVAFSSLSKPQSVALSVLTPDGQDVTAQTQVTWTDAAGNYLAQGASLSGLPVGYQASYRITLPQELAMAYNTPQQADYVLTEDVNNITCQLTAIPLMQLSGKVKDQATNLPLSGAVVSVSQTFGGKYSKTLNTKTDGSGMFTLEVANVPTSVAFAASDYVSQTLDFANNEWNELNEFLVPDVQLKSITGATISIGFTYTSCSAEGEEAETQSWYSDYNNVDFALFNETKQQAISQYNVQYPQIVLLEEVEDGDVLRLTATSRTNAFMPVTATATIAEQKADATFDIVELGKISSSFTTSGNTAVVGTLYDAAGKLMGTYNYLNASLTISNLADGNYTLVSMGSSRLFNTIYDLAQLPQSGLAEGTDYVKNTVNVQSGVISAITIDEVPTLDESKLYYTGENTSFTVNKPSIVAGNYLTLTGRIDFKPAYATSVSNVQMIVDIPESCQFVENSVMVGTSTSSYTLNGNRITIPIPMARYTDRVRFCVIPTLSGEYAPSAFAQFDLDGESELQPIGSARFTADWLTISSISTVNKTNIPLSGKGVGRCDIFIYDNDVLIGQTKSLADGSWMTNCELYNAYNLSRHNIYAKVLTAQGLELRTEMVTTTYDRNSAQVSKVTQYNVQRGPTPYVMTFDFLNPSTTSQHYSYDMNDNNKTFTYTIEFTNNKAVDNVMLYVKTNIGHWWPLKATYDEEKDLWVTAGEFGDSQNGDLPVTVSVDFTPNYDSELDLSPLDEKIATIQQLVTNEDSIQHVAEGKINSLISKLENGELSANELKEGLNYVYTVYNIDRVIDNQDDIDIVDYLEELDDESLNEEVEKEREKRNHEPSEEFKNLHRQLTTPINQTVPSTNNAPAITAIINEAILDTLNNTIHKIDGDWNVIPPESSIVYFSNSNGDNIVADMSEVLPMPANTDEAYYEWGERAQNLVSENISIIADISNTALDAAYLINAGEAARCLREINFNRILMDVLMSKEAPTGYLDLDYYKPFLDDMKKETKNLSKVNQSKNTITRLSNVGAGVSAFMGGWEIGNDIRNGFDINEEWNNLIESINECDDPRAPSLANQAQTHKEWVRSRYVRKGMVDVVSTGVGIAGASLGPESLGLSILLLDGASLLTNLVTNRWEDQFTRDNRRNWQNIMSEYNTLDCNKPDPDDDLSDNPHGHVYPGADMTFCIDPSGFVYEGVFSNRLEGVTATCFYKKTVEDMYGDLHDEVVLWDATQYGQENPLFTDKNGFYQWDVPEGLWQVKFEKEGYETTYSEWLPVPPPQLDVNIAMKQNVQPMVKNARAYEDAVEVEFDKYMMPELLSTENIMVMQNGTAVEGTIELLNEEVSYEGETETFASKVRFNAAQPFTEQEITLLVNNRVKSYAGIRMQDNYEQAFTIEQEIKQIACEQETTIGYGNKETYVVSVLPASASAGKTLAVKTSSPMILSVENENIVIGSDGKAEITMTGELPGTAALTFSIEGADITSTMMVSVEQIKAAARPTSSVASGSMVQAGTAITLSCASEGATIYYTLDGSCPCDESAERLVYDGTPIVINKNTIIKAMATGKNWYDSEVATFIYIEKMGDVNCDGNVDTQDAIKVIQYYLNKHPKVFMVEASDVTNDKKTDTQDAIQIIRIYLNNKKKAIRK